MLLCNKCNQLYNPEDLMIIKSEFNDYHYCKICLKQALDTLSMQIFQNKDTRALLKKIRRFLKSEKN